MIALKHVCSKQPIRSASQVQWITRCPGFHGAPSASCVPFSSSGYHVVGGCMQPHSGPDIISLIPRASICDVKISRSKETMFMTWYEGRKRTSTDITHMNEVERNKLKEQGERVCNRRDSVITLPKTDMIPFYIKHYRILKKPVVEADDK